MSRPTTVDPALGFKSLHLLLHEHEPAVIARAIKQYGIYTWDEFGAFVKAEDDGEDWSFQLVDDKRYKMCHKQDETTASRNTQSYALAIVSLVYKTYGGKLKSPATQLVVIEGILDFGWPKGSLPDFKAIQQGTVFNAKHTIAHTAQETTSPEEPLSNARATGDPFSVFRDMDNLTADEVRIEFAPNTMLNVSVRNNSKRITRTELLLVNKKTGDLNKQGLLLLGLARGEKIPKKEGKTVSLIRTKIFRDLFGIAHDPFDKDWAPYFSVVDETSRDSRRAKEQTIHIPYEEETNSSTEPGYDDEDDAAGKFLRARSE